MQNIMLNLYKMNDINVEGVILPNKSLSNYDLIDAVKKLGIKNFKGMYCRYELRGVFSAPECSECGILNLDENTGEGTHWVCWFIAPLEDSEHLKDALITREKFYFDSFGVQPPSELINYLGRPIYYNSERVQPIGTVVCGHLCLYVLKKLSDGEDFQVVINSLI